MGKILIVDDDPGVVGLLRSFLQGERGHTVVTAVDGKQALKMFDAEAPDLVLMDVMMPGDDGLVVLQKLKRRHPRARVIMVTAVDDTEVAHEAVAHGASGFITKPIDLNHLDVEVTFELER